MSGGVGEDENRGHSAIGADLLRDCGFSETVVAGVRHHHERWDGNGPVRLAAEAIPVSARIVSLAAAYEAMVAGGLGREPRSVPDALGRLVAESGGAYDPELVQVLRSLQEKMATPGAEPNLVWLRPAS